MKKRKKKFNFLKFIVIILVLYLSYYIATFAFNINTKNIVVLNNNYYSDEKIIETAKVQDYPKFILLNTTKMKKRLLKLDLIENVIIKKKYGFILEINITEKKILFYNKNNNKYLCSDNNYYELYNISGIPTLINYVPKEVEKKFVNKFKDIDNNIISKISDIEYSASSYDSERFLLYMTDGNLVYINISKMENLNKYIEISKKIDNKKGILYLDSGNYFEIKE